MKASHWIVPPLLLLAVAAGAEPPVAGPAETAPASAPSAADEARRAQVLAGCVRQVRTADSAGAAAAAYAHGCSINATHVPLQRAYMRRMLELGLPRFAHHPAKVLTTLRPEREPLAWAVVGYNEAKRNHWNDALEATLRAAETLEDNVSVLHNAGQLVAWYEQSPNSPRASDRTKRAMAELRRGRLDRGGAFADAHRAITAAYAEYAAAVAEARAAIAAVQAEIAETERAIDQTRQDLLAVEVQIDHYLDVLDDLEDDLDDVEDERDRARRREVTAGGSVIIIHDREYYETEIAELRREIREVNAHLGDLKAARAALRRAGRDLLDDLRDQRDKLTELRRHVAFDAELRLRRHFRWDPPAIDGRVVKERKRPSPATAPTSRATDAERVADSRLRLAELYLRHDMPEKAAETLKEVIDKYPSTPAARQARALLAKAALIETD
jgi:tetratricopeptide (TPR) repeat protein